MAKGNSVQTTASGTLRPSSASSGLDRIREAARKDSKLKFTNQLHHMDIDLLRQAYGCLKRDAATGVDGVTWTEYGEGLDERLADLLGRIHSGRYRAKPSKRSWIPKADGQRHPLGEAAVEVKIQDVRETLMRCRHRPISEQGGWLRAVAQGHCNYYSVPGNRKALDSFRTQISHA